MLLFIGPTLLSVGIPARRPDGSDAGRERDGDLLHHDAEFGFDVLRLEFGQAPATVEHALDASSNPRVRFIAGPPGEPTAVDVRVDAVASRGTGPIADGEFESVESLAAGDLVDRRELARTPGEFAGCRSVLFEEQGLARDRHDAPARIVGRVFRHGRGLLAITVRCRPGAVGFARTALAGLERAIRLQ
jgi:hypothetical protein